MPTKSELLGRIELGKSEEICGEFNPGFTLWTTAHGFSHYRQIKGNMCSN